MKTNQLLTASIVAGAWLAAATGCGSAFAAQYHVAQNNGRADDAGAGTLQQPFKTISAAAKRVAPGDDVVIHGGVYRETVARSGLAAQSGQVTTFRAAPGERVILSGADVLSGWKRVEGAIQATPWPRALGEEAIPKGWPAQFWQFPMNRKETVWVDGAPLRPVAARDALAAGTFWIDDANLQVLIWPTGDGDLNARSVEGGVRTNAWNWQDAPGVRLEGVTVNHCAGPVQTGAAVRFNRCNNAQIIGCRIEWNGGTGLNLNESDDVLVQNCRINFNGGTGFNTNAASKSPHNARLSFANNETSYNNWRSALGGVTGWAFAGSKLFRQKDSRLQDYASVNNLAHGLWFDFDHQGNTIERGVFHGNWGNGVYLEAGIGPNWLINSIISDTGGAGRGLCVANAPSQHIWHNTFVNNGSWGAWIGGSEGPRGTVPDVSFATDCDLRNNLFWNAGKQGAIEVQQRDWPQAKLENYVIKTLKSDGNRFFDAARRDTFQVAAKRQTLAQWRAQGWDARGDWADVALLQPQNGDVRPQNAASLRLDPSLKLAQVETDIHGQKRGAEVVAGAALPAAMGASALPRWDLRALAPLDEMPLLLGQRTIVPRVWMVARLRDLTNDAPFESASGQTWGDDVWLARAETEGKTLWAVVNPAPWSLEIELRGTASKLRDLAGARDLNAPNGTTQLSLVPFGMALLSGENGTLSARATVAASVGKPLQTTLEQMAARTFPEKDRAAATLALERARAALAAGRHVAAWEALSDKSLRGENDAANDRLLGEGRV